MPGLKFLGRLNVAITKSKAVAGDVGEHFTGGHLVRDPPNRCFDSWVILLRTCMQQKNNAVETAKTVNRRPFGLGENELS